MRTYSKIQSSYSLRGSPTIICIECNETVTKAGRWVGWWGWHVGRVGRHVAIYVSLCFSFSHRELRWLENHISNYTSQTLKKSALGEDSPNPPKQDVSILGTSDKMFWMKEKEEMVRLFLSTRCGHGDPQYLWDNVDINRDPTKLDMTQLHECSTPSPLGTILMHADITKSITDQFC